MNISAMTQGSVSQALEINISHEITEQLPRAFAIRYSSEPVYNAVHDINNVATSSLLAPQTFEFWCGLNRSAHTVNDWHIFQNDEYLIASVPNNFLRHLSIKHAAEKAYSMIFDLLYEHGYPYLIRTWNYFSGVTHEEAGSNNNYQLFCSGRNYAYEQHHIPSQPYPAATVIGTQDDSLQIYFIASKSGGIGIENANQVSAFEYPSSYSEDPPLFSRALLHRNIQQEILFISGTASITGHNTQYEGDVSRQTEVCLENIQHLITTAIHEHQFAKISISDLTQLKIYIKHAQHLDTVKTHLQQQFGVNTPTVYLQGDMCRSNLLVEIEALAISPLSQKLYARASRG